MRYALRRGARRYAQVHRLRAYPRSTAKRFAADCRLNSATMAKVNPHGACAHLRVLEGELDVSSSLFFCDVGEERVKSYFALGFYAFPLSAGFHACFVFLIREEQRVICVTMKRAVVSARTVLTVDAITTPLFFADVAGLNSVRGETAHVDGDSAVKSQ